MFEMLRLALLLSVILLLVGVTTAQETKNTESVSARDRAELQRFAKRFIRRMQQTRDVKPLRSEFFVTGIERSLITHLPFKVPAISKDVHGVKTDL